MRGIASTSGEADSKGAATSEKTAKVTDSHDETDIAWCKVNAVPEPSVPAVCQLRAFARRVGAADTAAIVSSGPSSLELRVSNYPYSVSISVLMFVQCKLPASAAGSTARAPATGFNFTAALEWRSGSTGTAVLRESGHAMTRVLDSCFITAAHFSLSPSQSEVPSFDARWSRWTDQISRQLAAYTKTVATVPAHTALKGIFVSVGYARVCAAFVCANAVCVFICVLRPAGLICTVHWLDREQSTQLDRATTSSKRPKVIHQNVI